MADVQAQNQEQQQQNEGQQKQQQQQQQQQVEEQVRPYHHSSLSNQQQQKQHSEYPNEEAGKNCVATESHRQQSIEATIIDIPPASPSPKPPSPPPSRFSAPTTPTPLPSPTLSSSTSASISLCYDTDSSSTSGTCRAHFSEHIYMQRPKQQQQHQQLQHQQAPQQFQQQQQQLQIFCKHTPEADVEADTEVDIELVQFKAEQPKSWPFFLLMISILEIAVFVFDYVTVKPQPEQIIPIPTDSVLIYRPDRRQQLWRFISYMVLHANWFHLGFNVVVQLLFGIPLEVVHGSARIAVIYFAGVFAGSLGTSVVDSEVYLVGASGGVYALLAAHLANLALNFGQMKSAVSQLVSVLIFVSCDLGYTFYTQCLDTGRFREAPAVSYIAHLTGSLAGLTIGLLVLRNFEQRSHANLIWWLALGIYTAFTIFAIAFNLINTVTAQMIEEQSEVITQHLLQDLGVS